MSYVRLFRVGSFETEAIDNINLSDVPHFLEKRARLVYSGDFESMNGPVTVTEANIRNLAEKHNSRIGRLKRKFTGASVPISSLPPLQVDHSRSAHDVIGRLMESPLELEEFVDEDGVKRLALCGRARVIGKENVIRVLDGRWGDLSIGADFDQGHLEELSVVPFPAAHGSSFLGKKIQGDEGGPGATQNEAFSYAYYEDWNGKYKLRVKTSSDEGLYEALIDGKSLGMFKSVTAAIQECKREAIEREEKDKLSGKDLSMKFALMKTRLSNFFRLKKKMSDEECEKEMKKLEESDDDEELKKLAAEMDEDEKKEKEEKETKLAAARASITQLSTDFRSRRETASLAAESARISSKLSILRASGRITPAEVKKINVKELAGKGAEAISAVMKSYEDRQPVIVTGQLGSVKTMNLSELDAAGTEARKLKELELETRKNMSLIKDSPETKKLASEIGGTGGSDDDPAKRLSFDNNQDLSSMDDHYGEFCKMIDSGAYTEAKDKMKSMLERMRKMGAYGGVEPTMHEQSLEHLAALQTEITQLSEKFDEAVGLAQSLASGQ